MKTIYLRLGLLFLLASSPLPQKLFARPASVTVTVCDESSLRSAIANGGTINFGCDGTIVLASTLQIATNTVLDATGHNVVLSGGDAVRVFFVASNIDLTMKNLTIANGKLLGTNGVARDNAQEGTPGESVFGAGIFNDGGRIVLASCSLLNNTAVGGDSSGLYNFGGHASGAGVYNKGGFLTVSNSLLAGNACRGGIGGLNAPQLFNESAALGGAIYGKGGAVVIVASEIRSNSATGGVVGFYSLNLYIGGPGLGGALFIENGIVAVNQTRFSNNQANGGIAAPSTGEVVGPVLRKVERFILPTPRLRSHPANSSPIIVPRQTMEAVTPALVLLRAGQFSM